PAAAVLVVAERQHGRDGRVVLDDVRRRHLLAGRRGALAAVEAGGGGVAGDVAGGGDDGVARGRHDHRLLGGAGGAVAGRVEGVDRVAVGLPGDGGLVEEGRRRRPEDRRPEDTAAVDRVA